MIKLKFLLLLIIKNIMIIIDNIKNFLSDIMILFSGGYKVFKILLFKNIFLE